MISFKSKFQAWGGVVATFAILLTCGCGGDPFERSQVTGKVTLDGEPIPYGEVLFSPDTEKGNSGPSVVAPIGPGGIYVTLSDRGAVPGPTIAMIVAFDNSPDAVTGGGSPNLLVDNFPVEVEVPQGSGEINFDLTSEEIRKRK